MKVFVANIPQSCRRNIFFLSKVSINSYRALHSFQHLSLTHAYLYNFSKEHSKIYIYYNRKNCSPLTKYIYRLTPLTVNTPTCKDKILFTISAFESHCHENIIKRLYIMIRFQSQYMQFCAYWDISYLTIVRTKSSRVQKRILVKEKKKKDFYNLQTFLKPILLTSHDVNRNQNKCHDIT